MVASGANARGRRLVLAAFAIAVAAFAVHVAWLLAGGPAGWEDVVMDWAYHVTLFGSAAACLLRARVDPPLRWAWAALGTGLALWGIGDVYWTIAFEDVKRIPYPSPADAGYLLALPCFYVAVGLMLRHRVGHFTPAQWVDGLIAATAVAAAGVLFLAPALIGLTKGNTAAVLTNLAYPAGDLVLIAFVAAGLVVSGTRGAAPLVVLAAGLGIWTAADSIYLYQEATSGYEGMGYDLLWTAGALVMASAACLRLGLAPRRSRTYTTPLWLPAAAGSGAAAILVWDHWDRLQDAAVMLAGVTLLAVAARLGLSFRENRTLVEALHSEAITDSLTGLANRRQLMDDLEHALAGGRPHHIALFDLDGFKSYNDHFGHPAGDALLRQLGGRLSEAIRKGRPYRLGGDEFCVLVPADEVPADHAIAAARRALSATGEGFRIGASAGCATLPDEAPSASEALRLADHRMYEEKAGRATRVANQTHDLLLRILREREPAIGEHSHGVARMATQMARVLEVDAEELDVIRRAAELHDIGKIAIPDEILSKPGPLTDAEWELIRRHTQIGERILGSAAALRPVAELVRASHERWDGAGYPDGKSGDDIPLGARIIAICDAYEAMTAGRPYKRAMDPEDAIDELRDGAGTQFDPVLVDVFVRLWRTRPGEPRAAGRVSDPA